MLKIKNEFDYHKYVFNNVLSYQLLNVMLTSTSEA